ncbi:MAG: MATE family efflux transporter [Haloferacaceae archaeon]
MSWPVMAEQVTRTLMRTVDVFITASFNPAAVVAIGLAELYAQFPLRIGLGLGGGAIALSSQDTGRGTDAGRDETITQALLLGVLLGIPIAVVAVVFGEDLIAVLGASEQVVVLGGTYLAITLATAPARHVMLIGARALQGTGDTRTPMYVNIFANLLNVVGSLVLGLGLFGAPELRVIGVGLATAGANVVSAALFFAALAGPWSEAGLVRPRNPVIARQLVRVGVPRTAEGFSVALARFPFNALLLTFGTDVNAGFQIGRRIYQQITAPASRGYNVASSIVVGQALGRDDPDSARFGGWGIAALGVVTVGAVGVGLFVAAEPLVRLFTTDPGAVRHSVGFVRAYGLAAIPQVLFLSLSGSLQGAGETRLPFVARAAGVFGLMLGFSYVAGAVLGFGALAAYTGVALSYVLMALVVGWGFARSDWAARAAGMMAEREEEATA